MFDFNIQQLHLTVNVPQALVVRLIEAINSAKDSVMSALDTLTTEVSESKTVMSSAVALLQGLKERLDAAIASGDPVKLQELSDSLDTSTNELAAAVTANTPAETPTP